MKLSFTLFVLISIHGALSAKINIKQPNNNYLEVNDSEAHYLQYSRHMRVPFDKQNGATWVAGNDVTGKTAAEITTIVNNIKALETNARQKEIYDKLKSAPLESNFYESIDHAKGIVLQRLEICIKMDYFNTFNTYSYASPKLTEDSSTTASHWEKGKNNSFMFKQKSGTAYQAISQLCSPGVQTKGECWGAIIACIWWGASQGMGEPAFNTLYPGTKALDMDPRLGNSYGRNFSIAVNSGIHVPGDYLYFRNHNYGIAINPRKNPEAKVFYKKGWLNAKSNYYWSGENAVYMGDSKYEGLGVVKKTAIDMKRELADQYNKDLEKVRINGGKVNGQLITFIDVNDVNEVNSKIIISKVRRAHHDR